ncbi:hypothetical protein E3J62_04395 [candidate division TA06 bacterium]|uniref:Uncharacterized protein n=1 Tax=candidate division TA06 bacterium TaxID=2250710 RepID=A0A523UV05_UNCT6|nr:MAG: hypothetical protein E3J62_04395 [candidate division TA06 bacterium]
MKNPLIIGLVIAVVGLGLKVLLDKFRKRISLVSYTVWHRSLGTSRDDPLWGPLKLTYRDMQIESLFLSSVSIVNESNQDMSRMELNIGCDSDSTIFTSHAWKKGSLGELSLTKKCQDILSMQKPEEWEYILRRRDYELKVFNRREEVEIWMVVNNLKAIQPVITVNSDHPGVKVAHKVVPPLLLGEPIVQSSIVGMIFTVLVCIPIIKFLEHKTVAVFLAAFLGLFAFFPGLLLKKVWKAVVRLLG